MLGSVKLTKNSDIGKYKYRGYTIGFDPDSAFPLPDGSIAKSDTIFGADMSSSVHVDNKWKNILILGYGQTQRLPDDTLTPEAKYSINFTQSNIKFCLSVYYNGSISFIC